MDAREWFWIVGNDWQRAWNGRYGVWVKSWPPTQIARIDTEEELRTLLISQGLPTPVTSVADIKAEAQRRIITLIGAVDLISCFIKQLNALMRATELTRKELKNVPLTAQDVAESTMLQTISDKIKAIRASSDTLEVSLPVDFKDNKHWPA